MVSWRLPTRPGVPARLPAALLIACAAATLVVLAPTAAFAAPPRFAPTWLQNFRPTPLWSGPANPATNFGLAPRWSYLQVVAPQKGPRLFVYVPWTDNYAYVDATSVGPSGAPPFLSVPPLASATRPGSGSGDWLGAVNGKPLVERLAPAARAPAVKTQPVGASVHVVAWVVGDELASDDWTWARLSDGHYAFGEGMKATPPTAIPAPTATHPVGKWVDVNLLRQVAVAYVGDEPVHLAIVSTGRPGWETPLGTHRIGRRVADETMLGSSLSTLGLDALKLSQANYDYQHVLFTQYFDGTGDALHDDYWLPAGQFGLPHTHGCIGMPLAEAQWFWNWAGSGVPVVVQAK